MLPESCGSFERIAQIPLKNLPLVPRIAKGAGGGRPLLLTAGGSYPRRCYGHLETAWDQADRVTCDELLAAANPWFDSFIARAFGARSIGGFDHALDLVSDVVGLNMWSLLRFVGLILASPTLALLLCF